MKRTLNRKLKILLKKFNSNNKIGWTSLLISLFLQCHLAYAVKYEAENANTNQCNGTTYYVAPNGSDNNPGTIEEPFASMSKVGKIVQAGDVVIFEDGDYIEPKQVQFKTNGGTKDCPIIVKAKNKHQAKILFTTLSNKAQSIWIARPWITIEGFDLSKEVVADTINNSNQIIRIEGDTDIINGVPVTRQGHYCTIRGNRIHHAYEEGVKSYQTRGLLVEDNIIYDFVNEGIDFVDVDSAIIRNNEVYQIGRTAILGGKGDSKSIQVHNNYVHNKNKMSNYGISLGGSGTRTGVSCSNSIAYNNLIVSENRDSIYAGLAMFGTVDCAFYNNVVIGSRHGFYSRELDDTPPNHNPVFKNNMIVNTYGIAYNHWDGTLDGTEDFSHNLFFATRLPPNNEPNSLIADPQFVDINSDWNLLPTSPAIDAGTDFTFTGYFGEIIDLNLDWDGKKRAAPWDIGIYEWQIDCPVAGTPCDDYNPNTENDVEDGNCNCTGTPIPNENCNLVSNGDFDRSSANWLTYNHGSASSNFNFGGGNFDVDVTNPSNKNWHIQLIQRNIPLEQKSYIISFRARSNSARQIVFNWAENGGSHEIYHQQTANLTTNWQTFNYTFDSNKTDLNARIVFFLGLQSADVYLDDVLIKEADCTLGNCEIVNNGNFDNGNSAWLTYDHSPASSNWNFSNNMAHASINNVGTKRWHIQLIQRRIAIEQNKIYNVSCRAKASAARKIDFRLQEQGGNYTIYRKEILDLKTGWQTYNFSFTSDVTDLNASILFSVGLQSADVYLDDISISELGCAGNREAQDIDTNIKIFPNPTSGKISVKYVIDNPTENGHISVFDIWGRQVHKATFEASSKGLVPLKLNALAAGHYFLQLQIGPYMSRQKIVIF